MRATAVRSGTASYGSAFNSFLFIIFRSIEPINVHLVPICVRFTPFYILIFFYPLRPFFFPSSFLSPPFLSPLLPATSAKKLLKRRLVSASRRSSPMHFLSSRCAVAFSTTFVNVAPPFTTPPYLLLNMDAKADSNKVRFCESMHWKMRLAFLAARQPAHSRIDRSVDGAENA